jgi:phosphoserine phosphatase
MSLTEGNITMRKVILSLFITMILGFSSMLVAAQASDPLPSWSNGPTKSAIMQFVRDVTEPGGAQYVRPEERIAAFDNDGTLWSEQPVVQLEYIAYQIKKMASQHPEWKNQDPYKAILEGDKDYLVNDYLNNHGKGMHELVLATHSGMTAQEFDKTVLEFFNTAQHPKFKQGYRKTAYLPMLELLAYLRKNDFKTYLSSGGGIDFMRVIAMKTYGVIPENVIGSSAIDSFEQVNGEWKIVKGSKNIFMHDGDTKPVGIYLHIGRVPIFVAGNVRSGGDIGQLTYSQTNELPNFQLLINHDDEAREFAYAEKDNASLNAAKSGKWHVVSMKKDWLRIFPFDEDK